MRTTTLLATTENIPVAIGFVTDELDSFNCPMNARMKIELAVDEIFCNIASYAYAPGVGEVVIEVDYDEKDRSVHIVFKDKFNPVAEITNALNSDAYRNRNTKVKYIGIYVSPIHKYASAKEAKECYYKIKELFLKYDIPTQCIDSDKKKWCLDE